MTDPRQPARRPAPGRARPPATGTAARADIEPDLPEPQHLKGIVADLGAFCMRTALDLMRSGEAIDSPAFAEGSTTFAAAVYACGHMLSQSLPSGRDTGKLPDPLLSPDELSRLTTTQLQIMQLMRLIHLLRIQAEVFADADTRAQRAAALEELVETATVHGICIGYTAQLMTARSGLLAGQPLAAIATQLQGTAAEVEQMAHDAEAFLENFVLPTSIVAAVGKFGVIRDVARRMLRNAGVLFRPRGGPGRSTEKRPNPGPESGG